MSNEVNPWAAVVVAILGAGGGKYVWDAIRGMRDTPPRGLRVANSSISTVVRARDELEEDNVRLRATLAEERAAHAAERDRWLADQARLRADIASLEQQIRDERARYAKDAAAADARYEALLVQVQHLRRPIGEGS